MQGAMNFRKFWEKLKKADPKLCYFRFGGPVFGLYRKMPQHPQANEAGCLHLMSIPSPYRFGGSIPAQSWQEDGMIHRGWKVVLRLLVDNGHVPERNIRKHFGYSWREDIA